MPEKLNILGNNLRVAVSAAVFVAVVFLIAWLPNFKSTSVFMSWSSSNLNTQCQPSYEHKLTKNEKLESILTRISIDKTLIITMVNKAYVENDIYNGSTTMLNTFLESFWLGENTKELVDNLLLVAADRTAYERCRFLRLNCYKLETDGMDFEGEKIYMSDDFLKMMWRRTEFLLNVLKMGFSFIFTDTDVLWLRNPFKNLSNDTNIDFQLSLDIEESELEPALKNRPPINTGFYFVRSNNKTIALFDKWHSMKDSTTGKKEQDVLVDLIQDDIFTTLKVNAKYLDTLYFSGFCSRRRDVRVVTTVHANCCRSIVAKVSDLTAVLRDWDVFKRNRSAATEGGGGGNETVSYDWSVPVNCFNSWKTDEP